MLNRIACALMKRRRLDRIKLPKEADKLIAFYDKWIEEHAITDSEEKRKLWWAMFYASKEGRDWKE